MRRSIRTLFVCSLVALMVYQPALACHSCGGWRGGHRPAAYGYGPVVYGGCGGCAYETVVYDSGGGNCGSCGSGPWTGCNSCGGPEAAMSEGAPIEATQAPATIPPPTTTAAPSSEPEVVPPPAAPAEVTPPPQLPAIPPAAAAPAATEPVAPPAAMSEPPEPLFGNEPAATPPAAAPPAAAPPAAPAEVTPPAATPPAATPPPAEKETNDLFGGTSEKAGTTTPAAPATPPAATPPAASPNDDLFGPSTMETPKNGGATITQKPAETPAAAEAKPAEKSATPASEEKSKPADNEKKEEKPKAEEKDDLFGSAPRVLHEAGGLASDEMRQWTDNTGNFSCRGRLVRFFDGHVRLLKDNGRTTTVPLARLSTGDLEFVNRQASAQQAEVGKTAQSPALMPTLAN